MDGIIVMVLHSCCLLRKTTHDALLLLELTFFSISFTYCLTDVYTLSLIKLNPML